MLLVYTEYPPVSIALPLLHAATPIEKPLSVHVTLVGILA